MANQTNPYQQVQQQIEQQRSKLGSSRVLRSIEGIKGLISRQKQSAQLTQTESDIQQRMREFEQLQKQQEQQQISPAQSKQLQMQEALSTLVRTGKGSSALYSLSKEDRAKVEEIASDLKRQRQQRVISEAEKQLNVSLTPELRAEIVTKAESAAKIGAETLELPSLEQRYYEKLISRQTPQFTPLKLEQPKPEPSQVYGPIQQFYTAAPPKVDFEVYKKQQIERGISYPAKVFERNIQFIGGIVERQAERQRGKGYPTLGATGVLPYTPTKIPTPQEARESVEKTLDVGLYFVPYVGQTKFISDIGAAGGRLLGGDINAAKDIAILGSAGLIFKGTRGLATAEIPTYKTTYLSLVAPAGRDFEVVTIGETARRTARRTDIFQTVITERGIATPTRYFTTGEGITRPLGGKGYTTFQTIGAGKINDAKPFALKTFTIDEVAPLLEKGFIPYSKSSTIPRAFIPKKTIFGVNIPGAKTTKGLSASLEGDVINIERTGGLSIPVISDKVYLGFGESSMSGSAKGITFFLKPKVIDEGVDVRFMKPAQITRTPFSVTFPKQQVETSIEKFIKTTTPTPKPKTRVVNAPKVKAILSGLSKPQVTTTSTSPYIASRVDYEVDYLVTRGGPRFTDIGIIGPSNRFITIPGVRMNVLQGIREEEKGLGIVRPIPKPFFKPKDKSIEGIRFSQGQDSKLNQSLKLKVMLSTPTVINPRVPRPPIKPPRKIKFPFDLDDDIIKKKGTKGLGSIGEYIAEIRRSNKWVPLGKATSFLEATKRAIFGARETLGQSIRIRKGSELFAIPNTQGFKVSKKNPLVLVQKRGTTLATKGERAEILRTRRIKSVRFFR